jgi:hypothetical protein
VIKVLLNHFQTISIVSAASIEWPITLRDFLAISEAGSSFSVQGLSLECIFGDLGKDVFLTSSISLYVLLPAALGYALVFWGVLFRSCEALGDCCRRGGASPPVRRGASSDDLLTAPPALSPAALSPAAPPARGGDATRPTLATRMQTSLMVVCFLLHATVTTAALRLLTCRSVGPEPDIARPDRSSEAQLRMAVNLAFRCDDSPERRQALAMALPVIAVFSLGVPVAFGVFLYLHRAQAADDAFRLRWAFGYNGFREETIWWEPWVMVRKLALITVTVLLGTAPPTVQLTSALLVTTVALTMHSWLKPYRDDLFNQIELLAQCTAALTVLVGLYIAAAGNGAAGGNVATIIVLAANSGLVAASIGSVALRLVRRRAAGIQASPPSRDKEQLALRSAALASKHGTEHEQRDASGAAVHVAELDFVNPMRRAVNGVHSRGT